MIEDYICRNATLFPDRTAIVCDGKEISYAQLWTLVRRRAAEFTAEGLRPLQAKVVRASQTADFLITYFAVHVAGGVMVPLESNTPDERCKEWEALTASADLPPGTADILFTTGTTGQSKGVMISHEAILANAENLVEAQGYTSELTFIICGPLNHIGSLSKVYPVILVGGTLYITPGLKDVDTFFAAFRYPCRRFATFLVPAALRMLMTLSRERLQTYAPLIEFIETGAAPLSQADMEQLCQLLPGSRLYNTYASTETGIICTHDFNADLCVAGCLGRPMKHSHVFITPSGTVACQGKTLMTGYVGDAEMTAEVLRDATLFTHDNGRMDAEGRLHLSGRMDDVINVGGLKVAPSEVEDAALTLPEVKDCICISVQRPVMGPLLKLLVVMAEGHQLDKKKIARHLRSKLEAYKVPLQYEAVGSIRRTYNGKADRKFYR